METVGADIGKVMQMATLQAPDESASEPKDDLNRNILLETFDNIRDDLRRGEHLFALKVRIVCGRQIQGSNVSPKVCILFRKQKRWTQRETVSTNEPFWGESFYFNCVADVESLLRESVTFRVVNSRMLRRNLVIGEFQLSLVLVAGQKSRSMFNRWLALVDPNEPATICKGFLKVCVAVMFPNETEVQWPEPLAHNSMKENVESAVLTCSGHTFLKMTFIVSVYLMQDIPRYDIKGRKVTAVVLGLSFAGKIVKSEMLSLPDEVASEQYQIKKELYLTVSWPSMCSKLNLMLFSVVGAFKELWPICCHSFRIRDISVENSSTLKRNVRSEAPQKNAVTDVHSMANQADKRTRRTEDPTKKDENKSKTTTGNSSFKGEGFMPMIGPCFVNMYGAPLDTFEDKVDASYIERMNSGDIEGCAYRGRMFVRLRSEFCDTSGENTCVKDLHLGNKEQKDLQLFAKSNTFLLFGMISAVPIVSDAKCMMQFELSIGHSGINNLSATTNAQPYPSTSYGINPKEILKTQRVLSGHSYSTLALDKEKPASLIESSWEDIRYRLHFYNYIVSLDAKWDKQKNLIVMSYKLGLSKERILAMIKNLCQDMQQCMAQTPIPTCSQAEAGMNDMDKQWMTMRHQQLKSIYNKLSAMLRFAISVGTMDQTEVAKAARLLCEKLTDISLLLGNIKKEPQLSIPDVFIYLLVNNERRAYARVPVASIYYCQADAVHTNPVDTLQQPGMDYTRYRGSMANRMETIFLKLIPGLKGYSEDEYWPIPGMIRVKLLFGLTTTLRNGVLPPVNYFAVIYEYTKLSSFFESLCSSNQKTESTSFKTDSSGVNTVESSSSLLKANPTHESSPSKWRWVGGWMPWPDTSILVNSSADMAFDFVFAVHMREKVQERGQPASWNFIGYYTEDMERIVAAGNHLDNNFAMDTSKWTVTIEKDPLTGEEVGWKEVKYFEEYSKDILFREKDITSTVRLESNFARKLLQRKRRRKDMVYTETITINFVKSRDNRWIPNDISRFDGVRNIVDMDESVIRSWTHLQNFPPLSVDFSADEALPRIKPSGEEIPKLQDSTQLKTFHWIDDWQELMLPMVGKDKRIVDVTFERRKILSAIIGKDSATGAPEVPSDDQRLDEYGGSLTDSMFHIIQQKADRVKRTRMRRLIEPSDVSLSLQSTSRDRVIKLAPFPTFIVQRRVSKRSRLCCLFNTVEQIPAPITVTAAVDTSHISRWEMRCYFHEARDLLVAEHKDQLYVYAILSVSGMSAASSIIRNDFHTQLWRWNETMIFRNLVFHEDAEQVAASPPVVVIEFFRKLPIHNDVFLGRCVIEGENFVVQMAENDIADKPTVLQWYNVQLRGSEDAGCVLAAFHFRHRDTFRTSATVFENSFLTPPEKNMMELFKQDRVVLDNRKRFEIPTEILPVLVPHVLKITSWGLRQLRNYMLSRVTSPTIEFRIGHNVLQTENLKYDKSPNFVNKFHSLLIYLPLEISYLPSLFLVVRDSRPFGRSPLIGMAKIPLHVCRFKDAAHLDELEPEEIDFFMDNLCGRIRSLSASENNTYKQLSAPLKIDHSREFFFLFEPPAQSTFHSAFGAEGDFLRVEPELSLFDQVKQTLLNFFLSPVSRGAPEGTQTAIYKVVLGDETLSKAKPDWWCKYYLSKTRNASKAANYLEGDRLDFYFTVLEDAVVQIGDSNGALSSRSRFIKSCQLLTGGGVDGLDKPGVMNDIQRFHQVSYNGFDDVFSAIDLQRCKQMSSDEENRKFGLFLGKVRLYYLGALVDSERRKDALKELYRSKTSKRVLPYTQLYSTASKEMTSQDCLVRVYIIRALELQAGNMASLPNSYVEVFTADNNKETQLCSNKTNSIEMDSNPVYGQMFELYCIIPFQTRLRIRVMDKSSLLFDEEIGSTTIDLEKRMTTVYRAMCGLPESYRHAGINAWRDMHKPSEILRQVCKRFDLEDPHWWTENDPEGSQGSDPMPTGFVHRCYLFPPGCPRDAYESHRQTSRVTSFSLDEFRQDDTRTNADLDSTSIIGANNLQKISASGDQFRQSGDDDPVDDDPVMMGIERDVEMEKEREPLPSPAIFRLEDFDAINETRGIHLGPNDHESEICRERLALNILRRLPLVREHVETRPLYNPLQPDMVQGRLEMWVDIFSLGDLQKRNSSSDSKNLKAEEMISKMRELLPPPVDVSPREPQPYELRVVVWSVHEVISETDDAGTSTGDLYVRAWMEGLGDTQETDVHYNSLEGEGEFNWRYVFQLDYLPHERAICGKQKVSLFNRVLTKIPPMLHLQLWDNRRFRFDDFIGSVELDLSKLTSPSRTKDSCFFRQRWAMDLSMPINHQASNPDTKSDGTVNLFEVQRVYGYWPLSTSRSHELSENKSGSWMVGKILMELEMLSKEEAALKPAGLGRGEPNQNPELPEPKRLSIGNSFLSTSLAAFRRVFWPKYKWFCIGGVLMIIFVGLIILILVNVPISVITGRERSVG